LWIGLQQAEFAGLVFLAKGRDVFTEQMLGVLRDVQKLHSCATDELSLAVGPYLKTVDR
jgi:hypothetical protein